MPAPYSGRCACGTITLTIEGEPIGTRQCWCRQCQKLAAGGPTTNAIFPAEAVMLQGELGQHAYVAASGNTLSQYFCRSCGCAVYAQSSARMHLKTIRVGMFDEGHSLRPEMVIWTADAPDWAIFPADVEQYPGQPPAPPPPSGN